MRVVFGVQYHLPMVVLAAMSASIFARGLVMCFGSYALAVGRPQVSVYSNAVGLAAVLVLSAWLIPDRGALGAALAALGGTVARLCYFAGSVCMMSKAPLLSGSPPT